MSHMILLLIETFTDKCRYVQDYLCLCSIVFIIFPRLKSVSVLTEPNQNIRNFWSTSLYHGMFYQFSFGCLNLLT